jgi:putative oxidoreductase
MNQVNVMPSAGRSRRIADLLLRPRIGQPSPATVLVRFAVGGVFLSSGLVKFLFDNQGPGRFAKLELPAPTELAHFVGGVEVVCGTLLMVGLFVRLAAVPLILDMAVALVTTKVPLLFGAGPEPVAAMPKTGFWAFAYQARLDVTMLASCVFLVVVGAGLWSLDAALSRRRWEGRLMSDPRVAGETPASGRSARTHTHPRESADAPINPPAP